MNSIVICQYSEDEEKHGYKGLKFNKTLMQRAETKNYKPKVVLDDDLVKTFSLGTPKCVTAERAREDLSGEREKLDEPSGCGFLQPCMSIGRHSEMDGHNILGVQEPLQRSCKQALAFDSIVRAVNRPVYEIQTADNLLCSQTFPEYPSSSKKTLQVYHRRYGKNQRHNKCEKVQPFFEGCTIEDLRRIRGIPSSNQLSHSFRKGRTRSGKHQYFLQKV
ncbi:hypothetical protein K7X08_011874 [Anisodus acutangulus]|uniref:Uncharacterized protein n=1 Tax=Anisodus acutangulus TaxID=402998 RepID=A0A9Q1QWJ6_9SOLA|nr:hypothetical protein K7X08_011874 [Anisodus acutangulus]